MKVSSDSEKEVVALLKKLREVEIERDILKKAAPIFGRSGESATASLPPRESAIRCGCYVV